MHTSRRTTALALATLTLTGLGAGQDLIGVATDGIYTIDPDTGATGVAISQYYLDGATDAGARANAMRRGNNALFGPAQSATGVRRQRVRRGVCTTAQRVCLGMCTHARRSASQEGDWR